MDLLRLEEFEDAWGKRYPAIGEMWRRAWEHVVPFFAFAPRIRKMIYTTNAVEALHRSYLTLGIPSPAQAATAALNRKFPESRWRADALDILQKARLEPAEDEKSWISRAFQ
jgi:Transposase, Mutator family